ncbi:MAG TPA: hypothetical protein VNQ80_19255 [Parapedobacter sp.]|uniref:hypothetical protein n=1 Tax=Parapedobacter sp. TaxID=1958893 RepID=UPI002BA2E18F|nr:hypothetical protein [Parapedobacter sp.]HWK59489.1 hypothetical protein [Parapedobacter sp.]
MKTEIHAHLNDPKKLETLYRANRTAFKQAFNTLYPTLSGNIVADYWNERLNYDSEIIHWGTKRKILFVIIASAIAGLIAQFPSLFGIDEALFYSRNIGFIVFPFLALYFAREHKQPILKTALPISAMLVCAVFINLLPNIPTSDTVVLSCLHLIPVLWSATGLAFVGNTPNKREQRIKFLTYNGDLLVMMALIVIAGAILTGITIGLFSAIGFDIEDLYAQYIGITGLAVTPLIATYLTQTNPQLVGKVSPVIARIFCPLVLVMLLIYLLAMAYGGKDPYTDRDFLVVFNILLVGVMAIVFFSIAGTSYTAKNRIEIWVLTLLVVVTVVVNAVALSAILFRISEWGITPNRAAVLGANLLVLINLLSVLVQLFKVLFRNAPIAAVRGVVSGYLPIYSLWALIVTIFFPLIFGF